MDYLAINKKLWNNKVEPHVESEFYDIEGLIAGKNKLNSIERELLGNIEGKKILHLQCHFGIDTLCFERLGGEVTGVDFSSKAIEKANELAKTVNSKATFIESDIYALPEVLTEKFDIVFTSYGTVGWLPDLKKWATVVSHFMKPKGTFVMAEFHPVVWMMSYDFKKIEYNYMDTKPIIETLEGTYADRNAPVKNKSVSWNHGLAPVINSLIEAGLQIKDFKEYDYSPYNCFQNTIETEPGKFQIRGLENKLPMVYSLVAKK